MSRKGTVGRMAIIAGTPDGGMGRNQVLAVATTATATTGKVVMIDRTTTGTCAAVDLITFATHSEHFSGRLREQRSWNRNKQN